MKTELEKFRTRWLRWLGQKTRADRPTWVTLLDSNWAGWASKVHSRCNPNFVKSPTWKSADCRKKLKRFWMDAINMATMEELITLDSLYATETIERRGR